MTDPKNQVQRGATIQRAAIDVTTRTVSVLIATPNPIPTMRWIDGTGYIQCNEVLQCTPDAIDTTRLDGGISVLMDHCWDDVVGVTTTYSIDPDGVRAVIKFTRDPECEPIWQDIVDGIRRHVSVGAEIIGQQYDIASNTNTVTRWALIEVSFVAVPADAASGVGRSKKPLQSTPQQTQITMTTPINHAQEIARTAQLIGDPEEGLKAVQEGLTIDQFNQRMLTKREKAPLPSGDMGLSGKEVQRYSVANVLRFLSGDRNAKVDFERDITRAHGERRTAGNAEGFYLPPEVQRSFIQRSFDVSSGAGLIQQNALLDQHIAFPRPEYIVDKLGFTVLTGLTGRCVIPRTTASGSVYWIVATSGSSESSPSVDFVNLEMKTMGAYVDVPRDLSSQSGGIAEQFMLDELQRAVMSGIQNAIINGTGLNGQPTGILAAITPSIDGTSAGTAPTYDHIVDLEGYPMDANAAGGFGAYIMSTKTRRALKKTFEAPGTNSADRLWAKNSQTPVNDYAAFATTDVPAGTSPTAGKFLSPIIHCADTSSLVLGSWSGMTLTTDTSSKSTVGATRVVVIQDLGVAFRNPSSFAVFKNALV